MNFGGKTYNTKFAKISEEMKQEWSINFHKIELGVMLVKKAEIPSYSQMQAKKGIDILGR